MRITERCGTVEETTQSGLQHEPIPSAQLGTAPVPPATYRRELQDAITMLYVLFDEAQARTNEVRLAAGSPVLIGGEAHGGGRLYSVRGYHGSKRTLSLFPVLPRIDGEHFGGVYVTPSGAAGPLYLVPAPAHDPCRWWVLRTWLPFAAQDADDLFLAVFESDTGAGKRLARLYGSEPAVPVRH
jgi:hypothetical protein